MQNCALLTGKNQKAVPKAVNKVGPENKKPVTKQLAWLVMSEEQRKIAKGEQV